MAAFGTPSFNLETPPSFSAPQKWGKGEQRVREVEQEVRQGETNEERRGPRGEVKNTELSFLPTHPFIDFSMLQLYKASTDSSNVALLIREGDPPGSLGVLQLWVCVYASVANPTIQAVHDHSKLHCREMDEKSIHE